MISAIVKILRKNEPGPVFPEAAHAQVYRLHGMSIIEAGMKSGRTAVALVMKDGAGRYAVCEISGEILASLAAALKGADQRFAEDPLPPDVETQ